MNHIFRLKRSGRQHLLQPVPETARSACRGQTGTGSATALCQALAGVVSTVVAGLALGGMLTLVHAQQAPPNSQQLPQAGVVTRGSANISTSNTSHGTALMTVNQTTNRAVIDWASFNIGSQAKVQFNQPGSSAVVLNQVLGNNASQIYGQLSANGQVILSNPNGIYFSPTASVDVGGLVATTGKANTDEFMAGTTRLAREGSTGSVVNEGQLKASLGGYIALLAPEVRNQGIVIAQAGTVALASGEFITLNFNQAGNGLTGITTTPQTIAALVENRSAVLADSGQIILSAHALATLQNSVVKNSGQLSATSLTEKGGKIVLMGDKIELTRTSQIEANGPLGGGSVLVGGDWQGSGDTRQALQVSMASGATIEANATLQGDGGKVVLWSDVKNVDSVTKVEGSIKAEAGPQGGDGGKIETSGHQLQIGDLTVAARAPQGANGEWLLDPYDVTISSGATSGVGITYTSIFPSGYSATANDSVVNVASLMSALGNTSVTIDTGSSGTQVGNITLASDISWSSSASLTLKAAGGFTGSGNVTFGGSGSLNVQQAGNSTFSGNISGASGRITIGGVGYAGTLTLTGNNSYGGGTTLTKGTLNLGSVNAIGTTGTITFGSAGGTLQYSLDNQTDYSNRFSTGSSQSFSIDTNGQNVTFASILSGTSATLTKLGAGTLTLSAANTYTGTTTVSAGTLAVTNVTGLGTTAAGTSIATGAALDIQGVAVGAEALTVNGGSVRASSGSGSLSGAITLGASSTVDVGSGAQLTLSGVISGTSMALTKTGSGTLILTTATNSYTGGTNLNAGAIQLASSTPLGSSGTISFAGGSLRYTATNTTDYSSRFSTAANQLYSFDTNGQSVTLATALTSSGGSLTKLGSGTLTLTGANTYSGATNINAGTLQIGSAGVTGALGSGAINNNGVLSFNRTDSVTLSADMPGSGSLSQLGTGTLTLTGNNSFSGGTTIAAGTLNVGSTNALSAAGTISFTGGTLQYSASNTTDYSARFDNATANQAYKIDTNGQNVTFATGFGTTGGTLTKSGSGTLKLSAANAYTGLTTVSAGTLAVTNSSGLGTTAAGTSITNTGTLDLQGVAIGAEALTMAGTLKTSTGNSSVDGSVVLNVNTTVDVASGSQLTLNGVVSGTASLTKQSAGSLILTATNTYNAGITISSGTLQIGGSGSLNSGSYTSPIANSGTFQYSSSAAQTMSGIISGTGAVIKDTASSTLTFSAAHTYTGDTTIQSGTLLIGSSGALATNYAGNIINNATFRYSTANTGTITGVMSGTGVLIKDTNISTLTMSGLNTFTGDVTLSAGSLDLKVSPTGGVDSRNYSNTGNTLIVRGDINQTGVMSGTGSYALYSLTTAWKNLSGANTFTGDLTLSGNNKLTRDMLPVSGVVGSGPLGLGNVYLISNANLDLNGHDLTLASGKGVMTNAINNTGIVFSNSTGTAYMRSPVMFYNGSLTYDVGTGGVLEISNIQNSGSLVTNTSGLNITKTGAGTLRYITPSNGTSGQYFSSLNISAGVMDVNSSTASGPIVGGPTANIASGAELKIGKYNANSLWLSYATGMTNTPTLVNNGTLTIYSDSTSIYSSTFSGGGLAAGTGRLVFSGGGLIRVGNNYNLGTGISTTIEAGTTVESTGTNRLFNNSSSAVINVLGTLQINGSNGSIADYSQILTGTGKLELVSGTMGLPFDNSGFSGTTQINSGANLWWHSMNSTAFVAGATGPIVNNGTLTFSRAQSFSVPNSISGSGGIAVASFANVNLSGNLTFNGNSTIGTSSTLRLSGSTAFGGTGGFSGLGTLSYESPAASSIATPLTTSYLTVNNTAGSLTLTNSSNNVTYTTVTSGTLQVGNGGSTGKLGGTWVSVLGNLVVNLNGAYSIASILNTSITGTGNITIVSGGDLTLNTGIAMSGTSSVVDITSGGNLSLGAYTIGNTGASGAINLSATGGITFTGATSKLNASGASGTIKIIAGANLLAGDTTANYDINLTAVSSTALTTGASGTITLYQGNPNTTALASKLSGPTATKKYKTYSSTSTSLSSTVSGTVNYYYRAAGSSITVSNVSASKTYDGTTNAVGYITGGTIAGLSGEESGLTGASLSFTSANFSDPNAGTGKGLTLSGVSISTSSWGISGLSSTLGGGSSGTINKANLRLTGSKTYDGTNAMPGAGLTAIGVNSESFNVTGLGDASNLTSANVQSGSILSSVSGLSVGTSNGTNVGLVSNYNNLITTASSVSVNRATATLTASKVYDTGTSLTSSQLSITGVTVNGVTQTLGATGNATLANANVAASNNYVASGTLVLTNGTGLASNYVLPTYSFGVNNTATVSPATVTLNAAKVYDGTNTLSAGQLSVIGLASQTLGYSGTPVLQSTNVADNSTNYVQGVTGLSDNGSYLASNYQLPSQTTASSKNTVTLIKANLTGVSASKTYDGLLNVTAAQMGSLVGLTINGTPETFTATAGTATISDKNVATASKYITSISGLTLAGVNGSLPSNYNLNGTLPAAGTNNTVSISQRSLVISGLTVNDKNYDGGTTATVNGASAIKTGLISGDAVTVSASGTFTDALVGTNKTVTLVSSYGGAQLSNYIVTDQTTTTGNIIPKPLALSIPGATRAYDGTTVITPTGSITLSGVINNENVVLSTGSVTGFVDKNVGTNKPVTYTGFTISGTDAGNYSLPAQPASTANITPLDLLVTGVSAVSRVYNASTNASLTGTAIVSPLLSDVVNVNSSGVAASFADKNVGTAKPVTVTGFTLSGADANNYNVLQPTGLLADISKANLPVTGLSAANKVYDATTNAPLSGAATVTGLLTDVVSLSGAAVGTFADKNVGTAKPVTVSGFTLTGTDAGNYNLVLPANLIANITKADLQVTGVTAIDKVYDATTAATLSGAATVTALLTDNVNVVGTGAGSFADKNVGNAKPVSITGFSLSGADANNYNVLQPTSVVANITPAPLTMSGIAISTKTYDGNTSATPDFSNVQKVGLFGNDDVTVTSVTGTFDNANAGTGKTVNLSAHQYGGADLSNYTITNQTSAWGNIDRKPLALSIPGATRAYDGTTVITPTGSITLSGVINNENVVLSTGSVTGFVDKNVGTNKPVTYTGFTISGADAGNYSLPAQPASTAAITAAPLTISGITGADKTYDGNTNAVVSAASVVQTGLIPGDTVTVTSSGVFADKNVGVNKMVTLTSSYSGADAGNYSITDQSTTTASINAKPMTISGIVAANKTYDGNTNATVNIAGVVKSGLVPGDTVTLTSSTGVFANQNAGNGKTVNLTNTYAGADLNNYAITDQTTTLANITPAVLTISGSSAASKTYDGTTNASISAGTLNGLIGTETLTVSGAGAFASKNVGNYSINTTYTLSDAGAGATAGLASNYTLSNENLTASISAKALSISGISAANKSYDGNTSAVVNTSSVVQTGLVSGDTVTVSSSGVFADKNVGVNKVVTLNTSYAGADAGNYSITDQSTTTASINAKALSISGSSAASKTYDGTTTASITSGTLNGLVGTETLTVSGAGAFASKNVGNYNVNTTYTLSDAGVGATAGLANNYTLGNENLNASISAKALSISGISAANKTYDGTTSAVVSTAGVVKSGLIAGDTVTVTSSGVFADKNAGAGKTVNLSNSYGGADLGNYAITDQTTAMANIGQAALTMTAQNASKLVGQADPTFNINYSGFVNGETASVLSNASVTRTGADTAANTYNGVLVPSALSANYNITTVNGNLTIVPADTLLVTLGNASKTYGASVSGLSVASAQYVTNSNVLRTVSLTPLGNGTYSYSDGLGTTGSFQVVTSANSSSAVGNYGITLTNFVKSGTNFTSQTSQDGNLVINPLAVTLGAVNVAKVYNGNTAAQATIAVANKVGADNVSVLGVGSYTDNKNVGSSHTYSLSAQLTGTAASNYYLSSLSVTGSDGVITPAPLSISGITAANKVYDGATGAAINTANIVKSGLIAGDTVTVSSSGVFADKNVGVGKTVTLTNTIGGADAGNYNITDQTTTTASISAKALSISGISAANKTYDGTTSAVVSTAGVVKSGLIAGDTVTVTSSGVFADKNAGAGKTVNLSNSYGGADLGNYAITDQTTAMANINAKALSIIGSYASGKTYDGNTNAIITAGTLSGLVGNETLTVNGAGSFASKNVGSYNINTSYTLRDAGIGATAGLAANYSLTNDILSASISAKALTISGIVVANKTYDGNTSATTNTAGLLKSGLIAGDVVTVSSSGAFSDKNAGVGKTVNLANNLAGVDAGNYVLNGQSTALANISPAVLTVTANSTSKTYDGLAYQGGNGVSFSGFVNNETSSVLGGSLTYSGSSQGASQAGIFAISPTGLSSNNYSLVSQDGRLTILPAPLKASSLQGAISKTYNGNADAILTSANFQIAGWVGNQGATVTQTVGQYDSPTVGKDKTVTAMLGMSNLLANSGTNLSNYTLKDTVVSGPIGTIEAGASSDVLGIVQSSVLAGGMKPGNSAATASMTYQWPALEAMNVSKALDAGLLNITVLRPDGLSSAAAVAFDQNAETISLRQALTPLQKPAQDKVVFSAKMTEFMVENQQGKLVEFLGGMVNKRMVIVAPSAESKQLAQAQMNIVLAGAIMALGKNSPILLAQLDGVVLDLR